AGTTPRPRGRPVAQPTRRVPGPGPVRTVGRTRYALLRLPLPGTTRGLGRPGPAHPRPRSYRHRPGRTGPRRGRTCPLRQGADTMTSQLDPIDVSTIISDSYRRYLRSLLPLRDPALASALAEQIAHSPLLSKGPLLE